MEDDSPIKNLSDIWQQQPEEEQKVSLQLIRSKAQELAKKTQWKFFANCGIAIALIAFDVWRLLVSSLSLQRIGFALAAAWAVYAMIDASRSIRPSSLAGELRFEDCLAFSLNELQRNLTYSRRGGFVMAGLILFTIGVFVAPFVPWLLSNPEQLRRSTPVLSLLLIWIVGVGITEAREKRKLRREISELSSMR